MKRFSITIENRAWPFDYPPRAIEVEALDIEAAIASVSALDRFAIVVDARAV